MFLSSFWTWLTSTFAGKIAASAFVSMLPVIELRGGLPIAVGLGLDPKVAIPVCVVANCLPVPFILLFVQAVFRWMRRHGSFLGKVVDFFENKANKNRDVLDKYAWLGLTILTAIPLPGTGAWTASLLAAIAGVRFKHAVPSVILGVFIAAGIMSVVSYGVAAVI